MSTVGQIHPHLEAKVIYPENGSVTPIGVPGELCVRGACGGGVWQGSCAIPGTQGHALGVGTVIP